MVSMIKMKQPIFVFLVVSFFIAIVSPSSSTDACQIIWKGDTTKPQIVLSFDDGGDPAHVRQVLDTLAQKQVPGVFFLRGDFISNNPSVVREIHLAGHEVGNHTYTHINMTAFTQDEITSELNRCEEAYVKATGEEMDPYVRPPYGFFDIHTQSILTRLGYRYIIHWTLDSEDWKGISADKINEKVLQQATNGSIILLHTSSESQTAQALPDMIDGLKAKGFAIVPLAELIQSNQEQFLP